MNKITRIDSNERLSKVVIHGDTIYIAGITASAKGDIVVQTRDVLHKIDEYLAIAGSDKRHYSASRFGSKTSLRTLRV